MFEHLYIHIPFCSNKCAYCAFYSETNYSVDDINDYFQRLKDDLSLNKKKLKNLKTVYIGGGTPSILSTSQLIFLFDIIKTNLSNTPLEISMECNPNSLTNNKIAIISKFVNRISLGVQSFNKNLRNVIGRNCDIDNLSEIIYSCQRYDIKNISADLIYAIPQETIDDLKYDLKCLVELGINHISAYSLTIEENSKLEKESKMHINNDLSADMSEFIQEYLNKHQINKYEISNHSMKNYECKHNLGIWHGERYLGEGPTACSFDEKNRWIKASSLELWLKKTPIEIDKISKIERAKEIFIMGLRTVQGWELNEFKNLSGFDYQDWHNEIGRLIQQGLLLSENTKVYPTQKGLNFWNNIAEEFLCH